MAAPAKLALMRTLAYSAGALLAIWLLGLAWFAATLPATRDITELGPGDGIIVLTGGTGRLQAGLDLLTSRKGERLLISGVHPSVTIADLSRLTGTPESQFSCCVDLDQAAGNTVDNARLSAAWAQERGYATVYLVTADYHMSRSLMLFRRAMPGKKIIPYPVQSEISPAGLVKEYSKTIVTMARRLVAA